MNPYQLVQSLIHDVKYDRTVTEVLVSLARKGLVYFIQYSILIVDVQIKRLLPIYHDSTCKPALIKPHDQGYTPKR